MKKILKWLPYFVYYIPFKLLDVVSPSKTCLLFGTGTGIYHDNSKYLFEAFIRNEANLKGYEIYWVAKNKEVYKTLKAENKPVLRYNSPRHLIKTACAKGLFVTAELLDVSWFISPKTVLIQLWHGTPIKYIGNQSKNVSHNMDQKLKLNKNFSFDRIDHFIIDEQDYQDIFQQAFNLEQYKFLCIGQPRNTFIKNFKKGQAKDILRKLPVNIPENSPFIALYCPTFRESFEANYNLMEQFVSAFKNFNQGTLLVKLHPFVSNNQQIRQLLSQLNSNGCTFDVSSYPDIQELMYISDALITDYSSCALDFNYNEGNIYYFRPDHEEYCNVRGGFYSKTYGQLESIGTTIQSSDELIIKKAIKQNLEASYNLSKYLEVLNG